MPLENSIMAYRVTVRTWYTRGQYDSDVGGNFEHSRGSVDTDARNTYFHIRARRTEF
jgi:hypothetical protein